jgi:hypothetical protein
LAKRATRLTLDINAATTDDFAANTAADDYNYATKPPKVKPLPKKPNKKESATAAVKPPPPAAAAAAAATVAFSINAEDPLTVSYYAEVVYDYADVVFHIIRTMQKGEYEVQVAEDGLLVSFRRAICSCSFNKKILHKIMGEEYRESSARIVAWDWDDTALEMQKKKLQPRNGLV